MRREKEKESGKKGPGTVADMRKRVRNRKRYVTGLLKKQGKYTPDMGPQIDIACLLWGRVEILRDEIFSPGHSPVRIEKSREGNDREVVSQKERLFIDYLDQYQRALKALGMNTDAKERRTESDGFSDFMKEFREDTE